jgi:hypothetical protein
MPRRDSAKAIAVLDAMLEFFDGGRRWIRGNPLREGQRCLISALLHVAGGDGSEYHDACHYLRSALASVRPDISKVCDVDLIGYNDESQDYDEVRALIVHARALAQAELHETRATGFVPASCRLPALRNLRYLQRRF